MADFFFYGTLLDPDVRAAVIGRPVPDERGEPAVLHDYRRVAVRGATYPMILPEPGRTVPGMAFRGFDANECARLSLFEGDRYAARRRAVALRSGAAGRLWVYMPTRRVPALPRSWTFEEWARRHRRRYLAEARQFARSLRPHELKALEQEWRRQSWRR